MSEEEKKNGTTDKEDEEEHYDRTVMFNVITGINPDIRQMGKSEDEKISIKCNDDVVVTDISVKTLNVSNTFEYRLTKVETDFEEPIVAEIDSFTLRQLLRWFKEHEEDPRSMPEVVFFREEDEKLFAEYTQEQLVRMLNGAIFCDQPLLIEQLKHKLIDYVIEKNKN